MSPSSITSLVRRKTRTNTSSYPDSELLADLNIFIEEIAGRIQQERPEIWNIPALADLLTDQREYAFPADVLNNLVSLEIMFDPSGDTDKDYKVATAVKRAPILPLSEENITGKYDNENPKYFIRRNSIFILSGGIVDVTDGLKLVYNSFPAPVTDLTSTTDLSVAPTNITHGFPREFHELLARRLAIQYKDIKEKKLNREEQKYEEDLERKLSEFSRTDQSLEEIIVSPPSASIADGYNL